MKLEEPPIKITIVTVCLNASATIEQAVLSVLNQNHPNLEYIIVDGGSTDGTLDIINQYKDKLSLVISEPDTGIYDAFNKGLRRATGTLIGILNADDFYAPWAFEVICNAYRTSPNNDAYYGKVVRIDEAYAQWYIAPLSDLTDFKNRMTPCLWWPAVFVPKQTYDKNGLFDESYQIAGDWAYFLKLHLSNGRFYRINDVLTAYRKDGKSSNLSFIDLKEVIRIYFEHLNYWDAIMNSCKRMLLYCIRGIVRSVLKKTEFYKKNRMNHNNKISELLGKYDNNEKEMWQIVQRFTDENAN